MPNFNSGVRSCAISAKLKDELSEDDYQHCFLVVAGGYDHLNGENVAHFIELQDKAAALGLPVQHYAFLKSPSTTHY